MRYFADYQISADAWEDCVPLVGVPILASIHARIIARRHGVKLLSVYRDN